MLFNNAKEDKTPLRMFEIYPKMIYKYGPNAGASVVVSDENAEKKIKAEWEKEIKEAEHAKNIESSNITQVEEINLQVEVKEEELFQLQNNIIEAEKKLNDIQNELLDVQKNIVKAKKDLDDIEDLLKSKKSQSEKTDKKKK